MGILEEIAGPIVGTALGMVTGGAQDRRQIRQQKKLMGMQIRGNKEMLDYQKQKDLEMWNATNYGAQMEHLKEAGLNPGLIYGMSGGGGATTGSGGASVSSGQADGANAGAQTAMQMGMMLAQKAVLESQAEKNKAEAEKIKGVDTAETTERTASIKFQNAVNEAIGAGNLATKETTAIESLKLHWSKQLAEYETWSTVNYAGKATDDPYSPAAKAMRAGIEQTLEDLKRAKTENDIAAATKTIKDFEAKLASEGISSGSPWFIKFMTDVLTKTGLDKYVEKGQETIKNIVK